MLRQVWVLCVMGICFLTTAAGAATVGDLRCESREEPLGIGVLNPLSWTIRSERRGERQSAYQILVADAPEGLAQDEGNLWDSGKTVSPRSYGVEYAGKPLVSRLRCFWKVRIWDRDDKPSAWSGVATWSMGLFGRNDWRAAWIGYDDANRVSPQEAKDNALLNTHGLPWVQFPPAKAKAGVFGFSLRKKLEIPGGRKVRRAMVVLYSHNLCAVTVNGTFVGQSAWWREDRRESISPRRRSTPAPTSWP